jgi:small-conductance mechanosensitive channel
VMQYQDLLQKQLFQNSVQEWLIALGILVGALILLRLFKTAVVSRLRRLAQKTATTVDDDLVSILDGISGFCYFIIALSIALHPLMLPAIVDGVLYGLLIIVLVYEVIQIVQKIVLFSVEKIWLKERENREHVANVLSIFIKIVLWTVGMLLILSNLGFEISSLVASLGIGGIAVALAVQNILGDIFSSFSIYFDRPFAVGDFIVVGDHMGTVKKIGLKTTRIEALQGEEIVISNTELTSTHIRNFKKMQKRRIVFGFGLTYDTPIEKLKKVPVLVKGVIDPEKNAELNRVHCKGFGDSSLDYEVVYYVLSGDYNDYMDTQQAINIGILEMFEKEEIAMAFPTRTVHLVK